MEAKVIIDQLMAMANPDIVRLKEEKFGIVSKGALGIYHKDLKILAKTIPSDSNLALQLFESGIYEAKILSSKIFNPREITEQQTEQWVLAFDNWEICDSFCMGVIAKSPLAYSKALEWSARVNEFEKRAGFVIMAAYCMADKKAENKIYESFLPIIKREANDDRLYVKKAVNWALRSIGKRNKDLNKAAILIAEELAMGASKSSKWIGKDALRELRSEKANILDYPRSIYRLSRESGVGSQDQ